MEFQPTMLVMNKHPIVPLKHLAFIGSARAKPVRTTSFKCRMRRFWSDLNAAKP